MSKEIDGTEYACLTINAFLEEENKQLKQRIAELEEQLKNAIVPKFKIGQEVWYVEDKFTMESGEILEIQIWDLKKDNIVYVIEYGGNVWCESAIFATKEEAQAKLKELQGE